MTLVSRFFSLYPTLVITLSGIMLIAAFIWHSPLFLLGFFAVLYVLPLLTYRLHNWLWPLKEGVQKFTHKEYNSWWGGHQIQSIYVGFPFLETPLRMVPGLYSAWLRLWGAKIGKGVYWTPLVSVVDRGLVDIGDHVVFGHLSCLVSHVVTPSRSGDHLIVYVKRVQIGSDAFIGAATGLGPGVQVPEHSLVPALTQLFPNERFTPSKEVRA